MENLCSDPCSEHNHCKLEFVTLEEISIEFLHERYEITEYLNYAPFISFNSDLNRHTCHNKDNGRLIQELKTIKTVLPIKIEPIPPFVFTAFRSIEPPIQQINLSEHIEPTLASTLKDYQKEGVYFGISKNGRVLIADEMGLGKTYQGLALADYYKNDWPLLVATTATMRETWVSKIQELLPRVDPGNIFCFTSNNQEITDEAKIVVTSYSLMKCLSERIISHKFGTVILDESHNVKNYQSVQARATKEICESAKRVILLSGTPALSRPNELYTQISLIDTKFVSFEKYALRYCDAYYYYGFNSRGASNLTELGLLLKKRYMIRRTKDEYLEGLTDKLREKVFLPADIDEVEELSLARHASRYHRYLTNDCFFSYYAYSAKLKVDPVCDYLKQFLKGTTEKCVIFAYHLIMLNGIKRLLNELDIEFIRIDGGTKQDIRNDLLYRFQFDRHCRVALMSLRACATGVTLTAAKKVIFAELTFTPGMLEQAESRVHRMGQTDDVEIKFLIVDETVDHVLWDMIIKKQSIMRMIGLNDEDLDDDYYANPHLRDLSSDEDDDDEINIQHRRNSNRINTIDSSSEEHEEKDDDDGSSDDSSSDDSSSDGDNDECRPRTKKIKKSNSSVSEK